MKTESYMVILNQLLLCLLIDFPLCIALAVAERSLQQSIGDNKKTSNLASWMIIMDESNDPYDHIEDVMGDPYDHIEDVMGEDVHGVT